MPRAPRVPRVSAVALLLGAVLLSGCGGPPPAATKPTAQPTPLSQLNTAAMRLPRIGFCPVIPDTVIRRALDGAVGNPTSWQDGQRATLSQGVSDVAHEFGCSWERGSLGAAAWVFAPPVTRREARTYLKAARKQSGCTVSRTDFGSPGAVQRCTLEGDVGRVRYSGLFQDTWFTCEVRDSVADTTTLEGIQRSAESWCVGVVSALNTQK